MLRNDDDIYGKKTCLINKWAGDREVDCSGLLIRSSVSCHVGSNPTLLSKYESETEC